MKRQSNPIQINKTKQNKKKKNLAIKILHKHNH